jgi:hypothetical protein
MRTFLSAISLTTFILLTPPALGQSGTDSMYRYENTIESSRLARDLFGTNKEFNRAPGVDLGSFRAGVSSRLDCGRLDITADIEGQLQAIKKQLEKMIPRNAADARRLASTSAMLTLCYAYPTVCAQLRHDFLSLQGNLNLRAQACQAIDKYIDNQADRGAMQLRAEAQAECVSQKVGGGLDTARATAECQDKTGLPLRDFQAGLEKRFTSGKQKVLTAIVGFAREQVHYDLLASMLGEIEVQPDGYWQPLFSKGLLRPADAAGNFLATGQQAACNDLNALIAGRSSVPVPYSAFLKDVAVRKLSNVDAENLADLGAQDRRLACLALGRALGREAAEQGSARLESVMASGLLNVAVPVALRDEYRSRVNTAFPALRAALLAEQVPPVDEVRRAISDLASATRSKNRLMAASMSQGRIVNSRSELEVRTDCVDTLSCEGRRQ